MLRAVLACALVWGAGASEWRRRDFERGAHYAVQSTLLLAPAAAADRELAYRLTARLAVQPAPTDDGLLLYFRLEDTLVLSRGAHRNAEWAARGSVWDALPDTGVHARWRRGRLAELLLDARDPPDVANYKRALVSLFQLQPGDGRYNETDVSGDCSALYETLSDSVFRKFKTACTHDGADGVSVRRVTRYSPGALHAEEVVTLDGTPPLKARSWHTLTALPPPAAPPAPPPPPASPAPLALPLPPDDDPPQELSEALAEHGAALGGDEAGGGGDVEQAAALLRLLPVLRAAAATRLLAALRAADGARLPGLCRALGLAATEPAVRAAADFLQLAARDPLEPLAHAFLGGFALAPRAPSRAVRAVLRLGEEARRPAVAEAALLAAAAAAREPDARAAVLDALLRSLARCADAACRELRLLALGNLGAAEAAPALVAHAAAGETRAALAAVAALRRCGGGAAPALERLALNASRALEVRAAALELLVERRGCAGGGAAAAALAGAAAALRAERGADARELGRVLRGRAAALAGACPALAGAEAALAARWAGAGGASAVTRRAAWRGAALDASSLAARGTLRRALVALGTPRGDDARLDDLEVEVWTSGLAALGGGGGGEGEEEEVSGGLVLGVGGARLRPLRLFSGQGELLAHVWAGTGAADTAVLRALRPRAERSALLPLAAGAALRWRAAAADALALDARAAASLWHRTARGALSLRAAEATAEVARVHTAWARLELAAAGGAAPRLRVKLELDFYGEPLACVRVDVPTHAARWALDMRATVGAPWQRVRRRREHVVTAPGRSLALDARTAAACRALGGADDD